MERRSRLQPLARAVLRTQSDNRLVALARDGKEAAFEEIVRRYRAALVAFAAAYGPPDPEDVVQESLLRSWDALRESTGEMHLKAWLYKIVRNRALNARRDSRPHEELSEELDGVPQPPEIALTNDELQRAVVAIGALPATQREALVRSALEGHTHAQIATAIGSSPGAVRQLIFRARSTVRHGVGAVIPLPLVAALADLGTGGASAAAGGAAGGVAAAGAAGGASLVAKTALVAAIGAVALGSGAAIKKAGDSAGVSETVRQAEIRANEALGDDRGAPTPAADQTAAEVDDRGEGGAGGSDDGPDGDSDDDSGGDDGSARSGPGPTGSDDAPGDDSSGPEPRGDDSPNSGPGSGSSGPGPSGSGDSGSDDLDSGSGHSGGDSSGPGDGGGTIVPDDDHSGAGGGGDTTTAIPETTVPEPDDSGPGGGDELELPDPD